MANDESLAPDENARALRLSTVLRRFVDVTHEEALALLVSFGMFFSLLSAYYIIRPVRDEMGVAIGKDTLHELFTVVFIVMLVLVPVFGTIAGRFPRRLVLPAIYLFFIINLIAFWLVMKTAPGNVWVASSFFVWGSVFNLFVVSLFWSLMAEMWSNDEAKRLYGFISAGGTAGALAGPLITQAMISAVSPTDLLLASAVLLTAAMLASTYLRSIRTPATAGSDRAVGGGILDGAIKAMSSPYLGRIALYVFLANVVGTFFYLEQSRLVGAAITDSAERVRFFSARDLMVSIATLSIELWGTAIVFKRFGLTAALIALPITAAIGTFALSFAPVLWVVAAVMVAERVISFALANPAIKVLYTLTAPDEKYKVQNFVDTVVYRGGDAASGWLYASIAGGAGFAAAATPLLAVPLIVAWLAIGRQLGTYHAQRAQVAATESSS